SFATTYLSPPDPAPGLDSSLPAYSLATIYIFLLYVAIHYGVSLSTKVYLT
ncbi:hypothetical protein C8J57DRAFT_1728001, partial [Mycena rebaudengoi]